MSLKENTGYLKGIRDWAQGSLGTDSLSPLAWEKLSSQNPKPQLLQGPYDSARYNPGFRENFVPFPSVRVSERSVQSPGPRLLLTLYNMFLLYTLVFPWLGLVLNKYIMLSWGFMSFVNNINICLFFKCFLDMNRTTLLLYLGKSPLNYTIWSASSYSAVYSVKKKAS